MGHTSSTNAQPQVVSATDLIEAGRQTPRMLRQEAFATDDRWIGFVRTEPGVWSGWHHHGAMDTYFYVLQGGIEVEYGADRDLVAVGPGDFCHIPGALMHRERTSPGAGGEAILVRMGHGPAVVNVEGPAD